jgi:hypothetical protein
MSKKRSKLSKVESNKEYNCIRWMEIYGFNMWDYGYNFSHGNIENHKWREFKTWKHNRKTQYKI